MERRGGKRGREREKEGRPVAVFFFLKAEAGAKQATTTKFEMFAPNNSTLACMHSFIHSFIHLDGQGGGGGSEEHPWCFGQFIWLERCFFGCGRERERERERAEQGEGFFFPPSHLTILEVFGSWTRGEGER